MIIGESERLYLRIYEPEDIDAVMTFWGDPEVMKFCPGSTCVRESIQRAIERYIALQGSRGHSVYAVVLKQTGKVIGACGFNTTPLDNELELIYHFSKTHWGKGYAVEAGNIALRYIKKNGRFTRVEASIMPENKASEAVLKKLGFEFFEMRWFDDSQREEPCYEYLLGKS